MRNKTGQNCRLLSFSCVTFFLKSNTKFLAKCVYGIKKRLAYRKNRFVLLVLLFFLKSNTKPVFLNQSNI